MKQKPLIISEVNLKEYPTTRYQGSKRKILPWIYETVKDLKFRTVLDGFGGTASASYLFKKMGKEVTYNDFMNFNHIIGKAIVENSAITLDSADIDWIRKKHNDVTYYKTIQKNFQDIYYLDKENKWLDKVVSNIVQMDRHVSSDIEYKQALCYYAIFQSCITKRPYNLFHRKNLYMRTNDNVERNFGNKTTWDRTFDYFLKKFTAEVNQYIFDNGKECKSVNESILTIDPYGYDLVYLDPPYISKKEYHESSDYMRGYHFLEGLSKYQEWDKFIDYESVNKRFKPEIMENDFKSDNIIQTFEEIVYRFRKSKIVISYKVGGVPGRDYLRKLVRKIKGNSHTVSKPYKYALNKQNGDAAKNREVLIIGT